MSATKTKLGPFQIFFVLIFTAVVMYTCEHRKRGASSAKIGPMSGDVVELRDNARAATSPDAFSSLRKSLDARDDIGVAALVVSGQVAVLDRGTSVRVLETFPDGFFGSLAEVRVESGRYRGSKLYLSRTALMPR